MKDPRISAVMSIIRLAALGVYKFMQKGNSSR